jgi:hypothetical protein
MTDTCVGHHPDTTVNPDIGLLCVDCYSRLRRTLLELPAIADWLHAHIAADGHTDEKVSGSREDPIPLRLDVLDLIGPDSRRPVGREHPEHVSTPQILLWEDAVPVGVYDTWWQAVHARWTEILDAPDPDVDVRRWQVRATDRGGVDQRGEEALRATVMYWARRIHDEAAVPWTDRNDLTGLVAWITRQLSWVAGQDWVTDLAADVWKATTNAHRLAPWREEIRRDTTPCARCQRTAVIVHIAAGFRRCEPKAGGCGREQPLSEYELRVLLPATRQAAG